MTPSHPVNDAMYVRAAVRLGELEQFPVGPALHAGLLEVAGWTMGSAQAIRATALWVKVTAHCQAQTMVAITEAVDGADLLAYASGHDAKQIIGEELAAIAHISSGAAIDHVHLVAQVGRTLPLSWEALDRGELTVDHLKRLARVTQRCSPRLAQAVDAQLIPLAITRRWTPQKLAKAAEKAIAEIDPDGSAERAETEKSCADVVLLPGRDETATLVANGDAVTLLAINDSIETRARELHGGSKDLPIGLCRFTALADLVLGDQAVTKPHVEVVLTMDLTTWLGLNEKPGELSGHGPITAATARRLGQDAAFRRLITDPITAETLDLGLSRYRPSEPLRRFVEARDRTCQFPNCLRRAIRCDLDHCTARNHRDPAAGGRTDAGNLRPLCRMHHNLKTDKLWQHDINPDGTETWTSALGFTYTKPPAYYPTVRLEPPDDAEIPEPAVSAFGSDRDPPCPDDPNPTPPPLTDDQYSDVLDIIDRSFGVFAERAYDTLRTAGLVA